MKKLLFYSLLMISSSAFSLGFGENTLVSTPDGFKPIQDLKKGDLVVSLDQNGHFVESKVRKKLRDQQDALLMRTNHGEILVSRGEKLFLSDKFVNSEYIEVGDKFKHFSGVEIEVLEIEEQDCVWIYGIEVEPHHNYFANSILVHNNDFVEHFDRVWAPALKSCSIGAARGGSIAAVLSAPVLSAPGVGSVPYLVLVGRGAAVGCAEKMVEDKLEESCVIL